MGIESEDTNQASDHLPRVFDISLSEGLGTKDSKVLPSVLALHPNYPNPFNPSTVISYELPEETRVTINIYDIMGQAVRNIKRSETQIAGYHQVYWNATNDEGKLVSAGVYLYVIQAGEFMHTKKMVLMH